MGPVAEFKKNGKLYQFGVFNDSIQFEISGGKKYDKTILSKEIKGKDFEKFVEYMTEWLSFPMNYVVYKNKRRDK
jgi:hypothetical protein